MGRIALAALLLLCLAPHRAHAGAPSWLEDVETHLNNTADQTLGELIEFLKIPSVACDPKHAKDVRKAGLWLRDHLTASGMENARLLETPNHPTVYADWLHAGDAPTVLIYGHYDVQPGDPFDLWTSPPFEPIVRNGNLYARGASDDKGHLFVPLTAIRAYLKVLGELPVNVKLLLEGEEEIGSPNLRSLLQEHRELLAADYSLSADGGQVSTTIPGICLALRGSIAMEVTLRVGNVDMHSGQYGGGVQNPIHALSHLLSTLRDIHTGRVLVDGFYDDVDDLTFEDREDIAQYPTDAVEFLKKDGINETVGEEGYSFYERTWCRPSIEVVGITGGFQGEGLKTVLPREASAKISARLVNSQDKASVMKSIKEHLLQEAWKIKGVSIEITHFGFEADPYKMQKHTPGNKAATRVLTELYGREPVFFRMGGSIPVLSHFQDILGLDTTMFAFGHNDENVHAPDEFARLDSFRRGELAYVRILRELGSLGRAKDEL